MTKMRMAAVSVAALITALSAASGHAMTKPEDRDCKVSLQELGEAKVNHYNALDGGDYLESIRLRLNNTGNKECVGVIKITRSSGPPELVRQQGGKISYTIVDQNDLARVIYDPLTNFSHPVRLSVRGKSKVEYNPRFAVPGSQAGRSGRYAATLEAGFYPDGATQATSTARLTVSAHVTPRVQANFVGSTNAQNARLDLGEIEPNKQGRIGLQVRSSSDYSISFRSDHNGMLAGPGTSRVPYSLTYAGRPIDLGKGKTTEEFIPPDPVRVQTNELRVIIGQFSDARAGNYQDRVTITISAF